MAKSGGFVEQLTTLTGLQFPDAPSGPTYGWDVRWQTPIKSLLVGSSLFAQHLTGASPGGSVFIKALTPVYYSQFDNGKLLFAGEYRHQLVDLNLQLGPYAQLVPYNQTMWYGMAAMHVGKKLQVGTYYSHLINDDTVANQKENNSKDLVLSARYDINSNFYAKVENHFLHGTATGFYDDDNPQGLTSRTHMVIGKLGFYF